MIPIADRIISMTKQAAKQYYRLVLVVAPMDLGKTTALQNVCNRTGAELINLNLELSRRMLNLTEYERIMQLSALLNEIVINSENEIFLLDNIENYIQH